jgi:hypothetical protein
MSVQKRPIEDRLYIRILCVMSDPVRLQKDITGCDVFGWLMAWASWSIIISFSGGYGKLLILGVKVE